MSGHNRPDGLCLLRAFTLDSKERGGGGGGGVALEYRTRDNR